MNFKIIGLEQANVVLSLDEVRVLTQALNEVCNGVDLFEFETRMGGDKDYVSRILKEFICLRDKMKNLR